MPAVRPRFHLAPCSKFRSHLNLPRTRQLLMTFARSLYEGNPYYLYPKTPDTIGNFSLLTKELLDIGIGCWLNPKTIVDYRLIAKGFDAVERVVDLDPEGVWGRFEEAARKKGKPLVFWH